LFLFFHWGVIKRSEQAQKNEETQEPIEQFLAGEINLKKKIAIRTEINPQDHEAVEILSNGTSNSAQQLSEVSAASNISRLISVSREQQKEVGAEQMALWEALSSSGSRFRVVSTADFLVMSGTLPDASDLKALYGMEVGDRKIDLHGVTVASYLAMVKLFSELEKSAKKLEFVRVPLGLRLVFEAMNKGSSVLSGESLYARPIHRDVEVLRKESIPEEAHRSMAQLGEETLTIIGLSPSRKREQDIGIFNSTWAKDNHEEACFWQDCFSFIHNVTNQVDLNLAAALISIQRKFTLLDLRAKTFSTAWDLMGLDASSGSWNGEFNSQEISRIANNLLPLSKKMLHTNEKLLAAVHVACHYPNYDIRNAFSYIFDLKQNFIQCASSLEAVGTHLGEILSGLKLVSETEQKIAIKLGQIPQEALVQVLEAIGIMNPDAESDPKVAAEEIFQEVKLAENDLHGCIIDLQAFDLIRQILERRISSMTLILKHVNSNNNSSTNWEKVRKLISIKIQTEFSSIQEKVSYNRFLGYLGELPISSEIDRPKDDFLF